MQVTIKQRPFARESSSEGMGLVLKGGVKERSQSARLLLVMPAVPVLLGESSGNDDAFGMEERKRAASAVQATPHSGGMQREREGFQAWGRQGNNRRRREVCSGW